MPQGVSTIRYNLLAKLCEPRKIVIPEWHETRRKSEKYKNERLKGIDRTAVSGRLHYWRIQKGVSAMELDRHLGVVKGTYRKEFENPCREPSDVEKVRRICQYLGVKEAKVFDDYLRFVDSDYAAFFSNLQKQLGYTKKRMAEEIGVGREVYRAWTKGAQKPTRTSFGKIQGFLEKYCIRD